MVAVCFCCGGRRPPRETVIVVLEYFFGDFGRRHDDCVDAAELEMHERAVDFGEIGE